MVSVYDILEKLTSFTVSMHVLFERWHIGVTSLVPLLRDCSQKEKILLFTIGVYTRSFPAICLFAHRRPLSLHPVQVFATLSLSATTRDGKEGQSYATLS